MPLPSIDRTFPLTKDGSRAKNSTNECGEPLLVENEGCLFWGGSSHWMFLRQLVGIRAAGSAAAIQHQPDKFDTPPLKRRCSLLPR